MTLSGGPLKVVRIVARLNVGGPARQVTILSRDLVAAGFDTVLVHGSLASGEARLECPVGEHVRVRQVAELGREIRPVRDFAAFLRLARIVFAERPDVVDTHTSKAGALGRAAAFTYNLTRPRRRRCLVVHTFHGHVFRGYFGPFGNFGVELAERLLARMTDVVITISPRQRDDIVNAFRIAPAERVEIVSVGLDLDELTAIDGAAPNLRSALGYGDRDIVFGFVGRLVAIKDPATLVRAFATVARDVPTARLMIVGDGELRRGLEALVGSAGIAERVVFLGWRDDLCEVYGTLDVLALSSLSEGTPVALIEAMASRRPTIATAVGGVPDIVEDGVTGLLVPPGDPAALAAAMIRLARDPGLRQRMGSEGRLRSSAFRAGRLVADTERLYRNGLSRKRGTAD